LVTREERDTRQRFRDRYGEDRTDVVLQIERAVIGGDWDATGYRTMAQADLLESRSALRPSTAARSRSGRGGPDCTCWFAAL
jgi:hypothetical protein